MKTRLWERNDAPPIVDSAPGADDPPPYLVVCHRSPDEAQDEQEDMLVDSATAVVYQWVRQIPR